MKQEPAKDPMEIAAGWSRLAEVYRRRANRAALKLQRAALRQMHSEQHMPWYFWWLALRGLYIAKVQCYLLCERQSLVGEQRRHTNAPPVPVFLDGAFDR